MISRGAEAKKAMNFAGWLAILQSHKYLRFFEYLWAVNHQVSNRLCCSSGFTLHNVSFQPFCGQFRKPNLKPNKLKIEFWRILLIQKTELAEFERFGATNLIIYHSVHCSTLPSCKVKLRFFQKEKVMMTSHKMKWSKSFVSPLKLWWASAGFFRGYFGSST